MLDTDLTLKTSKDGKHQLRILNTPSGKMYRIIRPLGRGGVGKVYLAAAPDGRNFVVKEYPIPKTPDMQAQQRNIRKNLEALIRHPILDDNGAPLTMMIPPIEVLDFKNTGTFGYIMDYVDLENYVSVGVLLTQYPHSGIVCLLAKNICHYFDRLASSGLCYKDVNESNIYLNPETGDVRIIDNDNVGDPKDLTISGTGFYMAPEIQMRLKNPDRMTDRFSLAAFLLRMFTGARPYEGPHASRYMDQHDQTVTDAASVIWGSDARFIFDPGDTSNSIENLRAPAGATAAQLEEYEAWQAQSALWQRLPEKLRQMFIRTLADGRKPERAPQRATARQWYNLFNDLEESIVVCRKCGSQTFGTDKCFNCGRLLPEVTCPNCGKTTAKGAKRCIHCPSPLSAGRAIVHCPHCAAENPKGSDICGSCGKFIVLTCAKCSALCKGHLLLCHSCSSALTIDCDKCGTVNSIGSEHCRKCGEPLANRKSVCPDCGRRLGRGQTLCPACGAPAPVSSKKTVHFDILFNIDKTQNLNLSITGRFPSFRGPFSLSEFIPGESVAPLFRFRYNPALNLFALMNCSSSAMMYRSTDADAPASLAPNDFTVITEGTIVKLTESVQMKILSIR